MDNIKIIPATNDGKSSNYGFHRTAEGRKFLKNCYGQYLKLQELKFGKGVFGHGKVAFVIADKVIGGIKEQEKEDQKTTAALRRWMAEGQGEVWQGDPEKNSSCVRAP